MRIGTNPAKEDKNITVSHYHRIIIPVYIPNFEGYFKETFRIFKLCIESLLLTCHDKTKITIYNNNSHPEVKKYIDAKYEETPIIDQVFHSKENVGKINAILAATKGNIEPLITITDADVLFKNNWQEAVENIFLGFPEAGMVSPVPSSKGLYNFVSPNWYYGIFKSKLQFENVQDPEAMILFDKSLGNQKSLLMPAHLKQNLVLYNKHKTVKAVMGCGHFVATLKRSVFDKGSNSPALIKIVGGVEQQFIDLPNEKLGFLRLATTQNFAFHMGNSSEQWMFDCIEKTTRNNMPTTLKANQFSDQSISLLGRKFGQIFHLVFKKSKPFKYAMLKHWGLLGKEY